MIYISNPLLIEETKNIILQETKLKSISDFKLNTVWEMITSIFGYDPMLAERNEILDGTENENLYLKCRPIKSVEFLKVNGVEQSIPAFTDSFLRVLTRKGYEPWEKPVLYENHVYTNKIEVDYTAGFEELPNQILYACILILNSVKKGVKDENGITSYSIDTISISWADSKTLHQEVLNILQPFLSFGI